MSINVKKVKLLVFLCLVFSCSQSEDDQARELVKNAGYSNVIIPQRISYQAVADESDVPVNSNTSNEWIWPLEKYDPEEQLVMKPDELLYNERAGEYEPFGNFVLKGEAASPVRAPAKGRITKIIPYHSFSVSPFTEGMANGKFTPDLRKFYRSGSIEMILEDGTSLAYRGLIPAEGLKEDQSISPGQFLGSLNYYFTFIAEPSLYVDFICEEQNKSAYFTVKSQLVNKYLGTEYDLALIYKENSSNPKVSLSSYYKREQPAPVLKDETSLYPQEIIWPLKGEQPGSNVIAAPGEELIYSWDMNSTSILNDLIIGGELGDEIIAMTSGTVKYEPDLYSLRHTIWDSWSGSRAELEEPLFMNGLPEKLALGGSLTIELDNGNTITYGGIIPREDLAIDSEIQKGEVIGTMAYSYLFIQEPSVYISPHVPNAKGMEDYYIKSEGFWIELTGRSHGLPDLYDAHCSDPAIAHRPFDNPFFTIRYAISSIGLEEDFFEPLSLADIKQDFALLRESLENYHPDLYHFADKESLDKVFDQTEESLHEGMTSVELYKTLNPIIRAIKGDHLFLDLTIPKDMSLYAPISMRVRDNRLYVTAHSISSTPELREQFPPGTEIIEINGMPAKQAIEEARTLLFNPDGDSKAFEDFELLSNFTYNYILYHLEVLHEKGTLDLVSIQGNEFSVALSQEYSRLPDVDYQSRIEFTYLTLAGKDVAYYCPRGLADYSGILDEKIPEMNEKGIRNIIIDLRNNPGGNGPTAEKVFSMFYPEPFTYTKEEWVMDKEMVATDYKDFIIAEGLRGFRGTTERSATPVEPSEIQYSGNVYVLTNPFTLSAAGVLANFFKIYNRGTLIGQGSGTPSGWINASQFFKTELPASGMKLRIPLVHSEYFTNLDEGIIRPDYEVKITLEDFLSFPAGERNWNRLRERKILGVVEKLIQMQ